MWSQVWVIAWAQMRIMRNHLPRTSFGSVLISFLSLLWYGMYAGFGTALAVALPRVQLPVLLDWAPVGLLGIFLFWQIIPLFTLSSGWSLELKKLQIYPISNRSLFGIEVFLRVTSAPEMILVLIGALVGFLRHPGVPLFSPLMLLLFIPLNLFLSLGIREVILRSFERNRFRELFAVLLISIAVLPQIILRSGLGERSAPYFLGLARNPAAPWKEVADLSLLHFSFLPFSLLVIWTASTYFLARWQFHRALISDPAFRVGDDRAIVQPTARSPLQKLVETLAAVFRDPLAALIQKEFQSLLRMPRFRVVFGMACVFSVLIFIPMTLRGGEGRQHSFVGDNFLPIVTLYGLLLLSDLLLLNIYGLDRSAVQLYFASPVPIEAVFKAKNIVAASFVVAQMLTVVVLTSLVRRSTSLFAVFSAAACSAVVGLFFISIGNLSSVALPRPIDPSQTFRRQTGGKMQLWFLASSLGMLLLVGFAYLAAWALRTYWAFAGVLLLEFCIGLITYRIALDSAIERSVRDRERIVEVLSRSPSPIGSG